MGSCFQALAILSRDGATLRVAFVEAAQKDGQNCGLNFVQP